MILDIIFISIYFMDFFFFQGGWMTGMGFVYRF